MERKLRGTELGWEIFWRVPVNPAAVRCRRQPRPSTWEHLQPCHPPLPFCCPLSSACCLASSLQGSTASRRQAECSKAGSMALAHVDTSRVPSPGGSASSFASSLGSCCPLGDAHRLPGYSDTRLEGPCCWFCHPRAAPRARGWLTALPRCW